MAKILFNIVWEVFTWIVMILTPINEALNVVKKRRKLIKREIYKVAKDEYERKTGKKIPF